VDTGQALADLTEISSQIETAVILDGEGAILGSTLADEAAARRVADGVARLLEEAGAVAAGRQPDELAQLEAATPHGSVFVVREGGRTIAATTGPEPTVGLVFYDLKSCLRSLGPPAPEPTAEPQEERQEEPQPKPRTRKPRKPKEAPDGAA
jgi:predicted regulator of Ras-like GTPase activity (Roadblock/LC7/MglB family)